MGAVFERILAINCIIKEIKLFARRACSFSLLMSSKEKILSAYICVRLRLIENLNLCLSAIHLRPIKLS